MTFFNRKEEVLEVELTPYGRYLLSLGELEPVYYSFFDDDVVYDSQYIGIVQEQNSIQPRILDNTPRLHTQANFDGIESNIKKLIEDCDCFVLPSYREGTSMSLLEAASIGRPIVTTDVDETKSYCIYTGSAASSYGAEANDQSGFSYGHDSVPGVNLTSSTNVRLYMNDLDADGPVYSRKDAAAKVTVVETQ